MKKNDIEFMSDTSAAVMQGIALPAHIILWAAFVFVFCALTWASFANIDEITRGTGKIIPSSEIQIIQSLEGGIVKSILVKEGDIVERGEILMIIDDTQFSSNLRESQVKTLALRIRIARLTAEAEGKDLSIAPQLERIMPQMADDEKSLYESRKQELTLKIQIFKNEVKELEQEAAELDRKEKQLEKSYELLSKELELTYPLVSTGAVSKVELLRLERTVNDLKGELEANKIAIPKIATSIASAKKREQEALVNYKVAAKTELNTAKAELTAMLEANLALADRVKRTDIISPVKGVINQININTIGGIIQPGANVMEIVPIDDTLLVEAEIKPADIGFLRPNLEATVKLTAYDFSIYGGLKANVVNISPDTILNEHKESVYLVKLRTEKNYLEKDGKKLPIISGMRASVDILTGKKTVLDYILKPILKTKQMSLTER